MLCCVIIYLFDIDCVDLLCFRRELVIVVVYGLYNILLYCLLLGEIWLFLDIIRIKVVGVINNSNSMISICVVVFLDNIVFIFNIV